MARRRRCCCGCQLQQYFDWLDPTTFPAYYTSTPFDAGNVYCGGSTEVAEADYRTYQLAKPSYACVYLRSPKCPIEPDAWATYTEGEISDTADPDCWGNVGRYNPAELVPVPPSTDHDRFVFVRAMAFVDGDPSADATLTVRAEEHGLRFDGVLSYLSTGTFTTEPESQLGGLTYSARRYVLTSFTTTHDGWSVEWSAIAGFTFTAPEGYGYDEPQCHSGDCVLWCKHVSGQTALNVPGWVPLVRERVSGNPQRAFVRNRRRVYEGPSAEFQVNLALDAIADSGATSPTLATTAALVSPAVTYSETVNEPWGIDLPAYSQDIAIDCAVSGCARIGTDAAGEFVVGAAPAATSGVAVGTATASFFRHRYRRSKWNCSGAFFFYTASATAGLDRIDIEATVYMIGTVSVAASDAHVEVTSTGASYQFGDWTVTAVTEVRAASVPPMPAAGDCPGATLDSTAELVGSYSNAFAFAPPATVGATTAFGNLDDDAEQGIYDAIDAVTGSGNTLTSCLFDSELVTVSSGPMGFTIISYPPEPPGPTP